MLIRFLLLSSSFFSFPFSFFLSSFLPSFLPFFLSSFFFFLSHLSTKLVVLDRSFLHGDVAVPVNKSNGAVQSGLVLDTEINLTMRFLK